MMMFNATVLSGELAPALICKPTYVSTIMVTELIPLKTFVSLNFPFEGHKTYS